ncbi:MAG: tetratricopeptide repeat protein [Chloroflexi bacterium]|nr:tetratricopeptide repeat protein [Chloroflexota bacterium]
MSYRRSSVFHTTIYALILLTMYGIYKVSAAFAYLAGDEASLLYSANLVALGLTLFKDFLSKSPLLEYSYGLIAWVSGANWWALRTFSILISLASALVVYLLGVELHSRKLGLVALGLYITAPVGFIMHADSSESVFATLLASLVAYTYLRGQRQGSSLLSFASGALLAVGYLANAPLFLSYFVALFVFTIIVDLHDFGRAITADHLSFLAMGFIGSLALFAAAIMVKFGFGAVVWYIGLGSYFLWPKEIGGTNSLWSLGIINLGNLHLWVLTLLFLLGIGKIAASLTLRKRDVTVLAIWLLATIAAISIDALLRGIKIEDSFVWVAPLSILAASTLLTADALIARVRANVARMRFALLILTPILFLYALPIVIVERGYSSGPFVGRTIPLKVAEKVADFLSVYAQPPVELLAADPQWALVSGRRQLLNLTYPSIYADANERVYRELGYLPRKIQIVEQLRRRNVILADDGRLLTTFPFLDPIVRSEFELITEVEGVKLYSYSIDHYARGRELLKQGRPGEALSELRIALKRNAEKGEIHGYLGAAYDMLGMVDEAIKEYKEFLAQQPGEKAGREIESRVELLEMPRPQLPLLGDPYTLGKRLRGQKLYVQAVEEFKRALEVDSNNEGIHADLGRAYEELGMYKEAIAEYEEFLRLRPTGSWTEDARSRIEGCKRLLEDPYTVGKRLRGYKLYVQAVEEFKRALEVDSNNEGIHADLGRAYEELGMYKEAIAEYEEFLRLRPTGSWTEDARSRIEGCKRKMAAQGGSPPK